MWFRIWRSTFFAVLAIVGAFDAASAGASECANLRRSTLHLYDIRVSAPEVIAVPAATLDRIPQGDVGSRHTLMLTGSDVVTTFEISHHTARQTDGSVCDAPSIVRVGFGAGRRVAYLARRPIAEPSASS